MELVRAASEERLRVAREVHDVVGHSLSVISMQAGVALHVLDRRPDQVAASLRAIRRTRRDALTELRMVGRTVTVVDEKSTEPLPATVDQAAYRIVQEALTNVVRHAGAAAVTVRIRREPALLAVDVRDDGPVVGSSSTPTCQCRPV